MKNKTIRYIRERNPRNRRGGLKGDKQVVFKDKMKKASEEYTNLFVSCGMKWIVIFKEWLKSIWRIRRMCAAN